MSTLGSRIKHVRGELSQKEFAHTNGITQVTLSRYERDERVPDADFIVHLCKSFNVLTDWLLLGRGPVRCTPEADCPPAGEDAPLAGGQCARCAALEKKWEKKQDFFEEERRQLTAELRQLWQENAALREKCARLEERQYQRSDEGGGTTVGHAG